VNRILLVVLLAGFLGSCAEPTVYQADVPIAGHYSIGLEQAMRTEKLNGSDLPEHDTFFDHVCRIQYFRRSDLATAILFSDGSQMGQYYRENRIPWTMSASVRMW
jgi:hypothetical protein